MKKDASKTAKDLVKIINAHSIDSYTNCLTRLRIKLKPNHQINLNKIRNYPNVLGVILPSDNEVQIVLGPGFVNDVAQEIEKIMEKFHIGPDLEFISPESISEKAKNLLRLKNNPIKNFFAKFSKVFTPLVWGFIGAGILAGIAGILQASVGGDIAKTTSQPIISWYYFLTLLLNIWKNAFIIVVGWRIASVFGGSGVLGAVSAAMYSPMFATLVYKVFIVNSVNDVNFLGFTITDPLTNWFTIGFKPFIENGVLKFGEAYGNIFGAMLAATASLWLEKGIRKFVPHIVDAIVTPTLVLLAVLFINFLILLPISGYLFIGVTFFFKNLHTNPFGAYFLAAVFLLTVSLGFHQSFFPIYLALFQELKVNSLFPILAMAGFAQVGTAIALWLRAQKDSLLRQQIEGAIIPGIFGIGEPLIYGVTLPRIKPFVTSSIAAGFGAFFIGAMMFWANIIFGLNAAFGPSGILSLIMLTTPDGNIALAIVLYLIGAIIALSMGILITLFAYSRVANAGIAKTKFWNKKIKTLNIFQKIICYTLLTLFYLSIVGFIGYWIYYYYSLPKERREQWRLIKVE